MAEVDDWAPVGTGTKEVDDWAPVGGKPAPDVPKPFMDRVRAGAAAEDDPSLDRTHDPMGRPGPVFATDPFEESAARTRRRYPQEERKLGLIPYVVRGLVGGMAESLATLPQRAIEDADVLQKTGEYGEGAGGKMPTGLEAALLTLGTGTKFSRTTLEHTTGAQTEQTIGGLPQPEDFKAGAEALNGPSITVKAGGLESTGVIENRLRDKWEQEGVHPAEAVHDARADTFLKHELTAPAMKEAPIVRFRREAADYEQSLPPVAEGNVRLWRGNRPDEIGQNPVFTNDLPGIALPFREAYGGPVSYVDVPAADLARFENKAGTATEAEFTLPKEIAATAQVVDPANIRQAAMDKTERILTGQEEGEIPLRAVGAEVTSMPPLTSPAVEPLVPPGRLMAAVRDAGDKLLDIGRDIQMKVAPMATGSHPTMAMAKDFANRMRRNRWEWAREDADIAKTFDPEQRKRMWDAADEESVARQLGESLEHQGLVTLEPAERTAVERQHAQLQATWLQMVDRGMVQGEGLPAYTPRMIINVASATAETKALPLNGIGTNLRTRTGNMMRRKYMMAEETEAAAKAKYGEDAELARDIRALPLANAQMQDALAGRTMIDNIKDYGKRTGEETVAEGFKPTGSDATWFTIDHPAFRTWKVMARDADGEAIGHQVPIYVRGDFEGPLRAVLTEKSGPLYSAMMSLKGKTMSLIMNSPLIHNAVEFGRAFPAMPIRIFKAYFDGNRAKNDPAIMGEAIDNGLVPIGKRFFNQDITSIMESPDLTPGRSWTAKLIGAVPGLFDEAAGAATKRAIDKAGDFWHNTLLWDRIADLQMGLYTNLRGDLLTKGVDQQTASRVAAHMANRYAGALPQEAMSQGAAKVANFLMFSRTFTIGNLGVMKDALTGLPKDVMAQIERDMGVVDPAAAGYAKSLARRKAFATVVADVGLLYVGNSILQSALNVMLGDSSMDKEMHGYVRRAKDAFAKIEAHPLEMTQYLDLAGDISSTSENEPGKQDRLKIGYDKNGTAIYARSPFGKIGEEFVGYLSGPLDMARRKEGTIARPLSQIWSNDKGFGRKVYDPDAHTPLDKAYAIWQMVEHLGKSQTPEGQFNAFSDLVKGEGDPTVNKLQAFGPLAGVTFSKGAPGGPARGEALTAKTQLENRFNLAWPAIRKQFQRGDYEGAQQALQDLRIPHGWWKGLSISATNPAARLNGRALKQFFESASPQQIERMERLQQQPAPTP